MATHAIDRFQALRFLRMQPWFAALEPRQQEQLTHDVRTLRARRRSTMLHWGEPVDGWYAVLSGFVKLQMPGTDDRHSSYLALTGGEWFGEGSALAGGPRRYEVVALRDTELVGIPRELFLQLLGANVAFANAVLRHMNHRLSQAMAIIEAQRTGSSQRKLAMHLAPPFWHGLRTLNLSQGELGSLTGLSRQTVNRELQALAARGAVTLKCGRVAGVDANALANVLKAA